MKFKKGDKAIINQDNPCAADLRQGQEVLVVKRNEFRGYLVRPIGGVMAWDVSEDCLDEVKDLPVGLKCLALR